MFKCAVLVAVSLAFALAVSAPAVAQSQSPGFYPGTTGEAKFNWGKQAYRSICGTSIPAQFRNKQYEDLFGFVQSYIESLSMDDMIDLMKPYCGNTAVAAEFVN